ncbi:tRNA 3'-trailer sequence RNase, putative [Plasmodium malariae]|uniref:ribonuclease Z n=1 Tax=Plasmodium malariae TaxID=5858 RepID=A0A1C3L172_PLAMA|nr:tRNA 3'-trailer sequence RNase, putative [Plasmodium malariae]
MEVYIQMIGWHRLAIPSSLRLFVNGDFTLFNCGENNQRFLNEHKLHLVKINNICFTKINPETIGGLIGLLLTIDNISDNIITIYGPKPIECIINSFTCSFAKLKNIKLKIHEISDDTLPIVLKGNVIITPIVLNEKNVNSLEENESYISNSRSLTNTDKRKKHIEPDDTCYERRNNLCGTEKRKNPSDGSYFSYCKKRMLEVSCKDIHKSGNEHSETNINECGGSARNDCTVSNGNDRSGINENECNGTSQNECIGTSQNECIGTSQNECIGTSQNKLGGGTYGSIHDNKSINNNDYNIKTFTCDRENNKKWNSICYLIECPPTIGKFHVEKARSLNIPSGKYYGILKSGKSITLNNKIIKPEDVCDENIDGRKSLVLDLHNIKDINYLIKEIENKESFYLKNLEYIFHLSSDEIINTKRYKKFFLGLKNVKNIKCNQSNSSLNVCPFVSTSSLNNFLSKLLPNIFLKYKPDTPIYDLSYLIPNDADKQDRQEGDKQQNNSYIIDKNKIENSNIPPNEHNNMQNNTILKDNEKVKDRYENESDVINEEDGEENDAYLLYKPLTKFVLHPFHKINVCTNETLSDLYPNIFNLSKISNILKENQDLVETIEHFNKTETHNFLSFPSFYFLGTGCSIPSTFRNVSGIILNIQENFSVILDFGEGSLYQLYWMSKSWLHFSAIIKSIKTIFISHAHADHHAGLYYFLYIRKILFPHLKHPLILLPLTLKKWMNLFNQLFFDKLINVVYNEENLEIKQRINDEDNFLSLHLFKVNHIKESYGIKIKSKHIGSVVYSADTRPCDNVKKYSKDCDILIHEATFDDELLSEAIHKKHSTTYEAMQISQEAKCKTLILTHFSQRYPKAPKLNKSSTEINEIMNKTICSFDYMCIPLNLINELPQYFNILLNLLEKIF